MNTRTEKAATQYFGETARGYEARRTPQLKWQREQDMLWEIIEGLPEGVPVLDCPCGTGRLFDAFALRKLRVTAIDISPDMLAEARAKGPYEWIGLMQGSIFDLCAAGQAFHTAFAIRIMNRISGADVPRALGELQRVTRDRVVFNLRVDNGNSRYRHPVKMSVVETSLAPHWRIESDVEIHEPDFRMITLVRL